jgi:hypothetical protein
MTAMSDIRAAARKAAISALNDDFVEEVLVEPAIGSDGDEILRITIVLNEGAIDKIDESQFLTTLLSIKRTLREVGDERGSVVTYATTAELEDDGDTES